MRLFAISDLHTDFPENRAWVENLSCYDYRQDVIVIAGDISDSLQQLEDTLTHFCKRFAEVFYVPGNHDLWVERGRVEHSLQKWQHIHEIAKNLGVITDSAVIGGVELVPLLSWYDYSFGEPCENLLRAWMDYSRCCWPAHLSNSSKICHYFLAQNVQIAPSSLKRITFSHFLPRIDIMPHFIPVKHRLVYPVLGSWELDEQVRSLRSSIHIYGHSHVNRDLVKGGVRYVNNALGYPAESWLSRQLKCIVDDMNTVG